MPESSQVGGRKTTSSLGTGRPDLGPGRPELTGPSVLALGRQDTTSGTSTLVGLAIPCALSRGTPSLSEEIC